MSVRVRNHYMFQRFNEALLMAYLQPFMLLNELYELGEAERAKSLRKHKELKNK